MTFDGMEEHLLIPQGGIKDFIRPGMTSHILTLRRKTTDELNIEIAEGLEINLIYKPHSGTDFEMSQYASQSDRPKAPQAPLAIEA